MTGLLEQPQTAAPEAPAAQAPDPGTPEPALAADRACPSCGTALTEGQDWCLECGSAQPGRLGTRHGWRAALTVLAATALLATGAVAAAYAALSSEATRVAAAPAPPSATPTVALPPSVPAPQDEAPVVPVPDSAGGDDADAPAPVDPPESDAGGIAGSAGTGATSAGSTGSSGSTGGTDSDTDAQAEPEALALKAGAVSTYDPYDRADGRGDTAGAAIDGKSGTAWEVPADAEGNVKIGLAISLEKARALEAIAFRADTPGFTVEVYGSSADRLPGDVLDSRWKHIDDRRDVGVRERIPLDGKFKHVLLWITVQPADSKVAVPEVEVFG